MFFLGTPIRRPEGVIPALAEGERHWRKGYSAYELAHAWVGAGDIPAPVRSVLDRAPELAGARLVEAFFEMETPLRSRGRPSQTDLLALLDVADGYAVVGIEGKVEEPFGPLVADWRDGGEGKERRLAVLCATLGLVPDDIGELRYQLLHRTAAAVYEAQRYGTRLAAMLVQSFSTQHSWLDEFREFAARISAPVAGAGTISDPVELEGVSIRLGWVADRPSD